MLRLGATTGLGSLGGGNWLGIGQRRFVGDGPLDHCAIVSRNTLVGTIATAAPSTTATATATIASATFAVAVVIVGTGRGVGARFVRAIGVVLIVLARLVAMFAFTTGLAFAAFAAMLAITTFTLPIAATTATSTTPTTRAIFALSFAIAFGTLTVLRLGARFAVALGLILFLVGIIGLGLKIALILIIVDDRGRNALRRDRARSAAVDRHPGAFQRLVDHDFDRDSITCLDLGQFAAFLVEQVHRGFASGAQDHPITTSAGRFFLDNPKRAQPRR